jgi:hypothetical protein
MHLIAPGKTLDQFLFVLPDAFRQIARDPEVNGTVAFARKDVDGRLALHRFGPRVTDAAPAGGTNGMGAKRRFSSGAASAPKKPGANRGLRNDSTR